MGCQAPLRGAPSAPSATPAQPPASLRSSVPARGARGLRGRAEKSDDCQQVTRVRGGFEEKDQALHLIIRLSRGTEQGSGDINSGRSTSLIRRLKGNVSRQRRKKGAAVGQPGAVCSHPKRQGDREAGVGRQIFGWRVLKGWRGWLLRLLFGGGGALHPWSTATVGRPSSVCERPTSRRPPPGRDQMTINHSRPPGSSLIADPAQLMHCPRVGSCLPPSNVTGHLPRAWRGSRPRGRSRERIRPTSRSMNRWSNQEGCSRQRTQHVQRPGGRQHRGRLRSWRKSFPEAGCRAGRAGPARLRLPSP